jgi:hypothetical protein
MLLLCADTPHGNLIFSFSFSPTHIHTPRCLPLQVIFREYSFSSQSARSESEEKGRFLKNSVAVLARVDIWMFLRVGEKEKEKIT